MPDVLIMTRTRRTQPAKPGPGITYVPPAPACPVCGASWRGTGGVIERAMPCECSGTLTVHTAWACTRCDVLAVEGCTDPACWDRTHVPVTGTHPIVCI